MNDKIVYKENISGLTWDNKLDNFIAKMETKYPKNDKELIRDLASNLMIKDLIISGLLNIGVEEQEQIFRNIVEEIEKSDRKIRENKKAEK